MLFFFYTLVMFRGIRTSQVKLGVLFLERGDLERALIVAKELESESISVLETIYQELKSTLRPDFWEVSDRGTSLQYLTPSLRAKLPAFFALIAPQSAPVQRSVSGANDLDNLDGNEIVGVSIGRGPSLASSSQSDPIESFKELGILTNAPSTFALEGEGEDGEENGDRAEEMNVEVEQAFQKGRRSLVNFFPSMFEHVFGNMWLMGPIRFPSLVNNDSLAEVIRD